MSLLRTLIIRFQSNKIYAINDGIIIKNYLQTTSQSSDVHYAGLHGEIIITAMQPIVSLNTTNPLIHRQSNRQTHDQSVANSLILTR